MRDSARHRRLKALFLRAGRLPAGERKAWLETACAGDAGLRAEVEEMLVTEASQPGFLEDSPRPLVQPAPAAPQRIGAFTIVGTLGEGGMGHVFLAEQDDPRRRVALKVLRYGLLLPRMLSRFEQEKAVLARLQHPGIAQIYDAGTAEVYGSEQPYFAMEYVDGASLTDFARTRHLSVRARLELFVRVCDGVQHAHQKGVIHRDLKPGNILVTAEGQPKILDFGVARATGADLQLTSIGHDAAQILGTLPYMSPEQAAGATEQIDARADVYGLGVILYELLTDRLPHDVSTTSLPAAVRVICEQAAIRIGAIRRHLRGDLETIVHKALAKEPERRYASADALAADVRRFLQGEPIAARPASRFYVLRKFARRNKLLVGAVVALIAALSVGLWFATQSALKEAQLRQSTERGAYCSKIRTALIAIGHGDFHQGRRLLDSTIPRLRDWEWRHLETRLEPDMRELLYVGDEAGDVPLFAGFVGGGDRALAVDGQSTVRMWDLGTEEFTQVRLQIEEPAQLLSPIALRADGEQVLSAATESPGSAPTAVILWESTTGKSVQRFPIERLADGRGAGAISPTGAHVAIQGEDALYLYPVASQDPPREFEGVHRPFKFSARGEWLLYADDDLVRIWVVDAGRYMSPIATGRVDEIALSTDRSLLASSVRAAICVRELPSGAPRCSPNGGGHVYSLAFAADGSALVSVADGASCLWDPWTGDQLRTFPAYTRYGAPPDFAPLGRVLLTAHSGQHEPVVAERNNRLGIRIWHLSGDTPLVLRGPPSGVTAVAVSGDAGLIASGSVDGEIKLWDAATSQGLATLRSADGQPVEVLAFDLVGERLVGGPVGSVGVWDTATGMRLQGLEPQGRAVAFVDDGALLVVTDDPDAGRLVVLDGSPLVQRSVLGDRCTLVAAAGGRIAAVGPDGEAAGDDQITIFGAARAPEFALEAAPGTSAVALSPDGRRLVTGSRAGNMTIWDLDDRRLLRTVRAAHEGEVRAVLFLNDRRVASGGLDGIIRIWDVAGVPEGEEPVEVVGLGQQSQQSQQSGSVCSLAMQHRRDEVGRARPDDDAEMLVSGAGDGTLRIWETQPLANRRDAMAGAARLRAPAEGLARRIFDEEMGALPAALRVTAAGVQRAARRAATRIDAETGDAGLRRAARMELLPLAMARARSVEGK